MQQGDLDAPPITAEGKRVVIIGGGDTGADCLGTAHRQGAASVHQFEILPRPPDARAPTNPWPPWSNVFRDVVGARGGRRARLQRQHRVLPRRRRRQRAGACAPTRWRWSTARFEKVEGTDFELPCELVLLAMGFVGPEQGHLLDQLGVDLDDRGNVARDADFMTNVPGVFACGDMGRGQSLIVWAIAEGRSCAAGVDRWLMGETPLPSPIAPTARPLM